MAAQASTCRHFYTRPNGWRGWRAAPSATPPPASTRSWPPAAASTYGTYPDIEGLIQEQASEMDGKKREAILHRIQQLIHEKAPPPCRCGPPCASSPQSLSADRGSARPKFVLDGQSGRGVSSRRRSKRGSGLLSPMSGWLPSSQMRAPSDQPQRASAPATRSQQCQTA